MLDPAELESLVTEGWRARRKTVKNLEYITVSKGGKDRSLGPFNKELWEQLEHSGLVKRDPSEGLNKLKEAMAKATLDIAELQQTLEQVKPRLEFDAAAMLEWKLNNCLFVETYGGNRFCAKYWWDQKPSDFTGKFPGVTFKRSALSFDGAHRKWRFTPHPDLCGLCKIPLMISL